MDGKQVHGRGMCLCIYGKEGHAIMEEWMFFLERYNGILTRAAVLLMGLIAIWLLARVLRQIKRLNKSLGNITGNIQAYFDVILREEEEEKGQGKEQEPEAMPAPVHTAQEGGQEACGKQDFDKEEKEEIFNAVLQEYFS